MLKFMVTIFFIDMFIRVIMNPRFSPILIIGRFMVRKQTPIYVGAPQKFLHGLLAYSCPEQWLY
jgi:hypothetical protein